MGVTFTFSTFTIFYGYKLYYIKLSMIFPCLSFNQKSSNWKRDD